MENETHQKLAFHLNGRRGPALSDFGSSHRPALTTRYRDLTELRYDFPLVIDRDASPERSIRSLSRMVDDAAKAIESDEDRTRIARHGHRIEAALRRHLRDHGPGDFATLWHMTADQISAEDAEVKASARELWRAFGAGGDLLDADRKLASRVVTAAWTAVGRERHRAFRDRVARLLHKLRGILKSEEAASAVGRAPERLRATVGTSFADSFDFEAMSRILSASRPASMLPESRRKRLIGLIEVLENQRFIPLGSEAGFEFVFDRCEAAIAAYNDRYADSVALLKAIAIAELEAAGDYREPVHDPLFDNFGANGLEPADLAVLPDYLICLEDDGDDAENARIVEILAAGLPFKVLVQTDDVLGASKIAEGHTAFGIGARQLAHTALALTDVFVLQSSAARLFANRGEILRGLSYDGPALFSVYSGTVGSASRFPAYLVSAAATESRVFPSFSFDPSAGRDWASRLQVDDNPERDEDWPRHRFMSENSDGQARFDTIAFTAADFMAMDERFAGHFAVLTGDPDSPLSVADALKDGNEIERVPAIPVVDDKDRLSFAIADRRLVSETRRRLEMWRSLQELAGIHNSHAERLLAEERKRSAAVPDPVPQPVGGAPVPVIIAAEPTAEAQPESDDPYIETARCTSCNECTHVNPKLFVYNDNKQAYIADPDAGTFRQLVEAAEGCQVGIIHPGKPRNPNEPGLDDLLVRAEPFR